MFGFIRPLESELKVREQAIYRAYYCGLCKVIGKQYGAAARLALNFDCTFLALTVSAFSEAPQCEPGRCALKPQRGRMPVAPEQPALAYAAAVNVLLAYRKLEDDIADEKSAKAFAGKAGLKPAFRRAERQYPALSGSIGLRIRQLSEIEKKNLPGTDAPADAFACLMRDLIRNAPDIPEKERPAAEWMYYNLGRWIYLADAWEDREKDGKSGSYNPFLISGSSGEDAEFLLNISLSEAEKGLDLLTLKSHAGILDNIVRLGCRQRTEQVLKEKTNESI